MDGRVRGRAIDAAMPRTADIYAHVTDSLMQNAADKIDSAIRYGLKKAT